MKKETLILRRLVGENKGEDESNNEALFSIAIQSSLARVVVKRPVSAQPLCDRKPSSVISGSGQRFDVYVVAPPAI